jgi:hypothetical protein
MVAKNELPAATLVDNARGTRLAINAIGERAACPVRPLAGYAYDAQTA